MPKNAKKTSRKAAELKPGDPVEVTLANGDVISGEHHRSDPEGTTVIKHPQLGTLTLDTKAHVTDHRLSK